VAYTTNDEEVCDMKAVMFDTFGDPRSSIWQTFLFPIRDRGRCGSG
jgi:hypothetical protein